MPDENAKWIVAATQHLTDRGVDCRQCHASLASFAKHAQALWSVFPINPPQDPSGVVLEMDIRGSGRERFKQVFRKPLSEWGGIYRGYCEQCGRRWDYRHNTSHEHTGYLSIGVMASSERAERVRAEHVKPVLDSAFSDRDRERWKKARLQSERDADRRRGMSRAATASSAAANVRRSPSNAAAKAGAVAATTGFGARALIASKVPGEMKRLLGVPYQSPGPMSRWDVEGSYESARTRVARTIDEIIAQDVGEEDRLVYVISQHPECAAGETHPLLAKRAEVLSLLAVAVRHADETADAPFVVEVRATALLDGDVGPLSPAALHDPPCCLRVFVLWPRGEQELWAATPTATDVDQWRMRY